MGFPCHSCRFSPVRILCKITKNKFQNNKEKVNINLEDCTRKINLHTVHFCKWKEEVDFKSKNIFHLRSVLDFFHCFHNSYKEILPPLGQTPSHVFLENLVEVTSGSYFTGIVSVEVLNWLYFHGQPDSTRKGKEMLLCWVVIMNSGLSWKERGWYAQIVIDLSVNSCTQRSVSAVSRKACIVGTVMQASTYRYFLSGSK